MANCRNRINGKGDVSVAVNVAAAAVARIRTIKKHIEKRTRALMGVKVGVTKESKGGGGGGANRDGEGSGGAFVAAIDNPHAAAAAASAAAATAASAT